MSVLLNLVVWAVGGLAILLLLPAMVLTVQVLSACRNRGGWQALPPEEVRRELNGNHLAVIIPAHDEAQGIRAAIAAILPQLRPGDRLVVVADNCTDDTARIAREAGADVIQRFDTHRRGKGYALDFGIRHLDNSTHPEVVVIVDADCTVSPGSLRVLAAECLRYDRPAQALDLMHAPLGAGLSTRIAELAWMVKNQVRPWGAANLGAPCSLMGTGMAFPWALIRTAPLASGQIVEDLQLGLHFAAEGVAPRFVPAAVVTSAFPIQQQALMTQKTRWEHGHLELMFSQVPRRVVQAIRYRRWGLLALCMDLSVPPLASLAWGLMSLGLLCGVLGLATGLWWLMQVVALAALGLLVSVMVSWRYFAPDLLSGRDLLAIPGYLWAKLPLYWRWVRRATPADWVRTPREAPPRSPDTP